MKRPLHALLISLSLLAAVPAQAASVAQESAIAGAADPVLEKRVMAIAEELRCLVCQNQNIADSHADLAIDLRNQVRDQLKAGKSDEEIKAYMVDRYGDFVLYRPPVKSSTFVLWLGPFLLLLVGLFLLFRKVQTRNREVEARDEALSADDRARAEALLAGAGKNAAAPTAETPNESKAS